MRIAITGSSGLLGQALTERLTALGHEILALKRSRGTSPGRAHWNPRRGEIDAEALEGQDAVIHLAGEPISSDRWTPAKKARIRDSRVKGTQLLAEGLAGLSLKPRILICASAVGYYGDRGEELCAEADPPGRGFLAETCAAWEAAAEAARRARITTLHLRIGMVLSPDGGALARMLPFFRFGLGGPLAGGDQYWSWIALPDLVNLIVHYLTHECESGPVNAVAPEPMPSRDFARTLGRVLHRPAVLPIPGFALKLMLGEMADELLLASARALPFRAQSDGFAFSHATLEEALLQALRPVR
ncbi:MAG TPA: TIGR01777 family oxidoreductase [Candidatus Krumholzibacteria bacterium]|nr:TIGR01777 family oxidoreductase [Candidatus Krumholzibacteria bacterium]